uniref:Uncharacterized protein n=1 Tax=Medicago truncatula TaxID=3880 RepID=Q2HU35_MEDTR|nr:hypothetical protein MtrDRAFT_AC149490g17v2 [Medicago truncatula]
MASDPIHPCLAMKPPVSYGEREAFALTKRCFPWKSNPVFPENVLGMNSLPLEPKQLGSYEPKLLITLKSPCPQYNTHSSRLSNSLIREALNTRGLDYSRFEVSSIVNCRSFQFSSIVYGRSFPQYLTAAGSIIGQLTAEEHFDKLLVT